MFASLQLCHKIIVPQRYWCSKTKQGTLNQLGLIMNEQEQTFYSSYEVKIYIKYA